MPVGTAHVLHVDDDPAITDLAETLLAAENIRVTAINDPEVALDRFDPETFDCVVSDYEMPELDGLELYERLCPQFDRTDFPYILFTGRGSESVAADALNAGVTGYLQKGGREQYERLANRVHNATSQHRATLKAERYETVLEALGYPVYVVDEEGYFRFVNEPFADLLGYDRDEIIGRPPAFLKSEETVERAESELAGILSENGSDVTRFEATLEAADGTPIRCRDHMGVLPYEGEQFRGSVGILRPLDGADAHSYPQSSNPTAPDGGHDDPGGYDDTARYETLVEALDDPIYVLDEEGRFEYVNDAFLDLTGYDEETIIGSDPTLIKSERARRVAEQQLGRVLSEDGPDDVHFEVEVQPKEGDPIPCEDHMGVLPYEGEQFRGSAGVLRDISDQKERERELERQNDRLDEFASVVSHDLRNPLNIARTRLELAREECENTHLSEIERAHERMETLIDDLLSLARQGQAVTELEAVELADVAERSWRTVEAPDATLSIDVDRTIEADPSRLDQLFENLFRNAVEHGGEDVTVTVGTLKTGFFVADDGVGLSAEATDRVFDSGYSTTEEGTGFGLSIVEGIATAHGWEVTAAESERGGARFEFTGVDDVPSDLSA